MSLRHPSLQAEAHVYALNAHLFSAFFAFLSDNWRGWPGVHKQASHEGELLLEATSSPRGAITLLVTLERRNPGWQLSPVWRVVCPLIIEAGQLERLAKSAGPFFNGL